MSDARWVLELLGSDSRSVDLPLAGTLVLGCSRERAGFVLEGAGVDDTHCAIGRTKEGDWAVKDLGSKNGTLLNGQKVAAARLKLGDQLVLGTRRLEVRAAATTPPPGSARPSDVPQRINGYRVERLIGKGGMGAVYLAVQESLRRPVALKVLAPKLAADSDFVHRFQAEARAAAALSHPNVVVVYDVGEEAGSHYLSMEFMAGGSLEQKLKGGPLPWKTVLGVLADAAAGLAYAESRGIVHRDIKPANLMYSGTGTVKIADLGLATTIEQEASEVVEGGRKVYGTPHFISPEQARGAAVDHRSDLYSLGATAYRLLSGHTPFEGATTREILRALQSDAPTPLEELVKDLPADLGAVIARLMQKEPAARFPTAESLRRECERLRLVAEHGPTLAVRRGSRAQLVLGVLLLLLVGGATAAWWLLGRKAPVSTPSDTPAVAGGPATPVEDPTFFGDGSADSGAVDEEGQLRAHEREAARALADVPPHLAGEERALALERFRDAWPGTDAARAAENELAALRPPADAATGPTLDEVDAKLGAQIDALRASGAPLAAQIAAIDGFRPPAWFGADFEERRVTRILATIVAAEDELRARFEAADHLAIDGKFDELRAQLAALEPALAGLDAVAADSRFAGVMKLRDDLAQRRGRVDEQERFFRADAERAAVRAVGASIGPGSGVLAELGALDLAALGRRLAALPEELRARAPCAALSAESELAATALASLRTEYTNGGWRRKSLVDPRSKRPREVRDVRLDGFVVDVDGTLETVSWREAKSDPEWWNQLFQGRLAREWTPEESRAIAALLHLVGATRGAEIAREMIDPRSRGTLAPGELEALGAVFKPARSWLEGRNVAAEPRDALAREEACAQRLARALAAAQASSWTSAQEYLELLLAEGSGCLIVALLSDGADWRAPEPAAAPPPSDGAAGK